MIRLRRIDHVCLRVADLDEAAARWCVQFGLTVRSRNERRAELACGYEACSLELVQAADDERPGHHHTGFELARDCPVEQAAAHLDRLGVDHEPAGDGLALRDPEGNGLELLPFRQGSAWPDVTRLTSELPGYRPRKLGHVNLLTDDLRGQTAFFTNALGMRVSDHLGEAGTWFHVNADHHVLAFVNQGRPHFHHLAFELVDWGELRVAFDHLAQHGRWLAWGPVRHGVGRNLCGYVRIPEEECLVELYCDMEQLEPGHEPRSWPDDNRSSNTWGILPPRSYFRFDEAAVESERQGLEALGVPLPDLPTTHGAR